MDKIRSFTDLIAWKKAHKLVLNIYKITRAFPSEERYGLIDQMRRAAVSVTSNIAEGFGRRTALDKNSFYYKSLTSLAEIQNQLIIARDLQYINTTLFTQIVNDSIEVNKLINSLIKSSTTRI